MKTGLSFLMAAKQCEMADLRQLQQTSALVRVTSRMIHELQRERGLSNLFLGSRGERFGEALRGQTGASDATAVELRAAFDGLDTGAGRHDNGARLFSRIAYVLHGLGALPGLRSGIAALQWTPARATAAYGQLIAGLLAVVCEAADTASDPAISRLLVALFNFMQGKEFAGQERATGAAMFASGATEHDAQQRLLHLIDSQERCLQVFSDFASHDTRSLWRECQRASALVELERMRRLLGTASVGGPLNTQLSQPWFDCCSQRMDEMRLVENQMTQELLQRCATQLAATDQELQHLQELQARLDGPQASAGTDPAVLEQFFHDARPSGTAPTQPVGSQLERSVLDMVQAQAQRLQSMADELDTVRASLNERKVIERAKGLLMAHRQLNEEAAHKAMRQMAMSQNKRLVDVAEAVLAMRDVLAASGR
ncbi:nitrate regulatory protein [Aquabacterium sp. A08]|uniref:nitrate regulatory protein n=1 Tax=Aquabacterium sp. A08 TaxID=2718532 RepID=UPI0014201504|nr:nitrate regulatory protein [Aquabacterium sp. A08]NIC42027.1 ANTAR domain-containing protein [Aquabacterium sp. A08]NIC42599.1 ANTAR domain-containing protein [Aquabacterium sp. A08]